jgi:peptidoglycan/LPS O-acetylase OafA/YrhL
VLFYLGLNDGVLGGDKVPLMQVILAFAITLALSVFSYFAIESPLSSLKASFGGAPGQPAESPVVEPTMTRAPSN